MKSVIFLLGLLVTASVAEEMPPLGRFPGLLQKDSSQSGMTVSDALLLRKLGVSNVNAIWSPSELRADRGKYPKLLAAWEEMQAAEKEVELRMSKDPKYQKSRDELSGIDGPLTVRYDHTTMPDPFPKEEERTKMVDGMAAMENALMTSPEDKAVLLRRGTAREAYEGMVGKLYQYHLRRRQLVARIRDLEMSRMSSVAGPKEELSAGEKGLMEEIRNQAKKSARVDERRKKALEDLEETGNQRPLTTKDFQKVPQLPAFIPVESPLQAELAQARKERIDGELKALKAVLATMK